MNKQSKPAGYNSVSSYLIVDGVQQLIDIVKNVFNAIEKSCYNRPDGKIIHVEVQIDDSIIMMADSTDQYPAYRSL